MLAIKASGSDLTCGGTGKTVAWILKLGEMATTISSIVATEYKDFGFTLCSVGSQDKFHPVWHHYYQDTNGLIYVVDSNDRDRVEEAKAELNKMMNEDEMRDAIVPACVKTLTSSTATRLGKLMYLLRLPQLGGTGGDSAVARVEVHTPGVDGAGCGKADKGRGGRGRKKGKTAGGGGRGPAAGKMTSLLAATPAPSGGVAAGRMDSGGLGVALPRASAGRSRLLPEVFHDCSYVGRRLSLLVMGPPSGR